MKMKIQFYESTDLWEFEKDLYEKWNPTSNHYDLLGVNLNIIIGFENDEKETKDIFTIFVMHEQDYNNEVLNFTTPTWFVKGEFSWERVYGAIQSYVDSCNDKNEEKSFMNLRRRMNWEFEGYEKTPVVKKEIITWIGMNDTLSSKRET